MNQGYSLRQAAKLSGVPTMTFHSWKEKGFVTPDVTDQNGNFSFFSEAQIERAKEIDAKRKAKRADNSGNLFDNAAPDEAGIVNRDSTADNADDGQETAENDSETFAPMSDDQNERIISSGDSDGEFNPREKEKAVDVIGVPAPVETIEPPTMIELAPAASVVTLEDRANRIRQLQADVQRGIIEIGFELIAAKKEIGHGGWADWLATNFDWKQQTANRFMRVSERFGKLNNVVQFKPSTLQAMLALPEGDEERFIEAQAESGKPVDDLSARDVQKAVKEWNRRNAPPADDDSSDNNPFSFEETANADVPPVIEGNHGKIAAVVAPFDDEEESISEDNSPASSPVNSADEPVTRKYAELIIDEEFSTILPPLKDYEFKLLEENILRFGIICPLAVWNCILLDGHARYEIARRHNLPFKIKEITSVADRDDAILWIIYNQLGRRSLTEYERAQILLKIQELNGGDSDDDAR